MFDVDLETKVSAQSVRDAFLDFKPLLERGGFPRPGILPVLDRVYTHNPPVESSFNETQLPYILRVQTQINAIALGRTVPRGSSEGLNLCSRIVAKYGRTKRWPLGGWPFTDSVIEAVVGVCHDHKRTYPELRPAMVAMLRQAGIAGCFPAIRDISLALDQLIFDDVTVDQLKANLDLRKERFVSAHPNGIIRIAMADPANEDEVRCLGTAFAKIISWQAIEAAALLAQNPNIQAKHLPQKDDYELSDRIRRRFRVEFPEMLSSPF